MQMERLSFDCILNSLCFNISPCISLLFFSDDRLEVKNSPEVCSVQMQFTLDVHGAGLWLLSTTDFLEALHC